MKKLLLILFSILALPANAVQNYYPENYNVTVRQPPGSLIGLILGKASHNRKLRKYLETCHDPSLNGLSPDQAFELVKTRGIKCEGVLKKVIKRLLMDKSNG